MSSSAHVLVQGLLLMALWWLFAFAYRKYRLDHLRQDLFEIRDKLFKEVASRDLFDHPAYGITRQTLNGMIRFAHEVSLPYFLLLFIFRKNLNANEIGEAYKEHLSSSLSGLKLEDKKVIVTALANAHVAILAHLVFTSVLLAPLAHFSLIILKCVRQVSRVKTKIADVRRWATIDAEAFAVGADARTT